MESLPGKDVDTWLESLLLTPDDTLRATLETSREAGLPEIAVSPLYGRFLAILSHSMRARRILEVGTLGGYSTIWLARTLPADGVLITLEASPHHAEVARGNLRRAGVAERVLVLEGNAKDTLQGLIETGEPAFDLVFLDADKENLPSTSMPRCRSLAQAV